MLIIDRCPKGLAARRSCRGMDRSAKVSSSILCIGGEELPIHLRLSNPLPVSKKLNRFGRNHPLARVRDLSRYSCKGRVKVGGQTFLPLSCGPPDVFAIKPIVLVIERTAAGYRPRDRQDVRRNVARRSVERAPVVAKKARWIEDETAMNPVTSGSCVASDLDDTPCKQGAFATNDFYGVGRRLFALAILHHGFVAAPGPRRPIEPAQSQRQFREVRREHPANAFNDDTVVET